MVVDVDIDIDVDVIVIVNVVVDVIINIRLVVVDVLVTDGRLKGVVVVDVDRILKTDSRQSSITFRSSASTNGWFGVKTISVLFSRLADDRHRSEMNQTDAGRDEFVTGVRRGRRHFTPHPLLLVISWFRPDDLKLKINVGSSLDRVKAKVTKGELNWTEMDRNGQRRKRIAKQVESSWIDRCKQLDETNHVSLLFLVLFLFDNGRLRCRAKQETTRARTALNQQSTVNTNSFLFCFVFLNSILFFQFSYSTVVDDTPIPSIATHTL